jgi:hypothetical protein
MQAIKDQRHMALFVSLLGFDRDITMPMLEQFLVEVGADESEGGRSTIAPGLETWLSGADL